MGTKKRSTETNLLNTPEGRRLALSALQAGIVQPTPAKSRKIPRPVRIARALYAARDLTRVENWENDTARLAALVAAIETAIKAAEAYCQEAR